MNLFLAATKYDFEDVLLGVIDKKAKKDRAKKGRSKKKRGRGKKPAVARTAA